MHRRVYVYVSAWHSWQQLSSACYQQQNPPQNGVNQCSKCNAYASANKLSWDSALLGGPVSGEDVNMVGGADADNNFMTLSDTSSCGKLTALAKLLQLWYHEGTANKVCDDVVRNRCMCCCSNSKEFPHTPVPPQ